MLDILAAQNAHATFFLIATAAQGLGPERLARLVADGHEIAYHSYNHDALEVLQIWGTKEWVEDYDRWVAAMQLLLGKADYEEAVRPYARAPYGLFSAGFLAMAERKGLVWYAWNTDVHEVALVPPKDGTVVLSHVRQSDIAAFEALVSNVDYRIVSIGEYNKAP